MLANVDRPKSGALATAVSAVVLLLGASTVFAELQNALDRIWRAPVAGPTGIWALLRARLLSFGMVLGIAFLLMVSLVLSAAVSALGKWWGTYVGEFVAYVLDLVVSLGLITLLFALIYKVIPRAKTGWHDVWIGAAITALLFTAGKFLIGLYLGKSNVASGFGAAGSFVLVMVWVYYSAQIFYFGAEFTWVYATHFGSRKGQALEQPRAETTAAAGPREPMTGTVAGPGGAAANSPPRPVALSPAARAALAERRIQEGGPREIVIRNGRLMVDPRARGLVARELRRESAERAKEATRKSLLAMTFAAAAGITVGMLMKARRRHAAGWLPRLSHR
jgi:membrane protein